MDVEPNEKPDVAGLVALVLNKLVEPVEGVVVTVELNKPVDGAGVLALNKPVFVVVVVDVDAVLPNNPEVGADVAGALNKPPEAGADDAGALNKPPAAGVDVVLFPNKPVEGADVAGVVELPPNENPVEGLVVLEPNKPVVGVEVVAVVPPNLNPEVGVLV